MKFRFVLAAAAVTMGLAGCSSVDLDESAKEGSLLEPATVTASAPEKSAYDRSIFFGFNQYTIDPKYTNVIEVHAREALSNPQARVVIEGNTDSRGSREYNIALGQKRSEAVKRRLQLLGVSAARIEAVSFGSEKPIAAGDTEEAWAQNRRADVHVR